MIEKIKKEALTIYPEPFTPNQIDIFLKKNRDLTDAELYQAWVKRKRSHIEKWRKRYGMDDFYPCGSRPSRRLFLCCWEISNNGQYSINYEFDQEPPLNIKGKASTIKEAKKRALSSIYAQYKRYGLSVSLNHFSSSGCIEARSGFEPEHDWSIWKSKMSSMYQISAGMIKQIISAYRKGASEATNLQELEELVQRRAKNV